MNLQLIFDVISRITHVSTAIAIVGGSVFILFVLVPSTNELENVERSNLGLLVNQRWKRFIHFGILLFIVSGFYNFARAIPGHKGDGLYHALLGTKILLAQFDLKRKQD